MYLATTHLFRIFELSFSYQQLSYLLAGTLLFGALLAFLIVQGLHKALPRRYCVEIYNGDVLVDELEMVASSEKKALEECRQFMGEIQQPDVHFTYRIASKK